MGHRIGGIKAQRLLVARLRRRPLFAQQKYIAARGVGGGKIRFACERFVQMQRSRVEIAAFTQQGAEQKMGVDVVRIEFQRAAVTALRGIPLARLLAAISVLEQLGYGVSRHGGPAWSPRK